MLISRAVTANTATADRTTVVISQRRFLVGVPESFAMVKLQRLHIEPGAFVGMADGIVAPRALHALRLAVCHVPVNRLGDVLVTAAAGRFRHSEIKISDADRVRVVSGREVHRMEETVARLYRVFPGYIGRRVAIVAGRGKMMARLHPTVILRAHGVTVRARDGIILQIGITFGVNKGIGAHADKGSEKKRGDD